MKNYAVETLRSNAFLRGLGLDHNSAVKGIYAHTNENLRQYMFLLNIKNGRVATVGSSGDQVFYSVFNGAAEVTLIDANPYAQPIVELKMAAIKNMSLKEFKDYWTKDKMLDKKVYGYLLGDVTEPTREFLAEYDKLRNECAVPYDIVKASSFAWRTMGKDSKVRDWKDYCEFYDNEETFSILKANLKNCEVKYVLSELKDFNKNLDGGYSTIMLSNIYDYYQSRKMDFINIVKGLINDRLQDGGTMQFHYKLQGYNYVDERLINDNLDQNHVSRYAVQSFRGMEDKFCRRGCGQGVYPAKISKDDCILAGENLVYIYEK